MVKSHTGEETQIYLTSVVVRNLSIDVVYDYPGGADQETLEWRGVKVIKKDGTAVNTMPTGGSVRPNGDQITGHASFEVHAPIVPDEIAYLEFPDGTKIALNTEK